MKWKLKYNLLYNDENTYGIIILIPTIMIISTRKMYNLYYKTSINILWLDFELCFEWLVERKN